MSWADWVMRGFALYGFAVFSWQVGQHGFRWVMSEFAGWFSVAKNDFRALEAKVHFIEQHIFSKKSIPPDSPPPADTPKVSP